jgi:hypothetical protein
MATVTFQDLQLDTAWRRDTHVYGILMSVGVTSGYDFCTRCRRVSWDIRPQLEVPVERENMFRDDNV